MTTQSEMLDEISRKVDQIEKLASLRGSAGPTANSNDILILMRYTMSLEKQVRQLQEDIQWILNGKIGPRPEVLGGRRHGR